MEENKKEEKKPEIVLEKSGKEFRKVDIKKEKKDKKEKIKKERKTNGVGKTIVVPFLCGVVGASAVMGTCFGVPQIRNMILSNKSYLTSTVSSPNTNFVSISNYSETGVAVAQKVLPSIVGIKVEYPVNSFFSTQSSTASAEGSGIIISNDGYILTNNHVVNSTSTSSFYELGQASKVSVFLYNDKTEYTAKVVGTDSETDLAVIKIEKSDLTAAELGDSDSVQVGEFAMAIGNPLGMQSSVTSGMISAVNREVTDSDGKKRTLTQTDTAINSGNSGGALVNSQGKVIGINTLKVSATGVEGMGFAIPINSAKPIYDQLIQFNKVKRPYIGVAGREITDVLAKKYNLSTGAYVATVEEFSPAEKAGIKPGDVITKADGQSVSSMNDVNNIKNKHQIGDTMTITVNRNGQDKDLNVTLEEQK